MPDLITNIKVYKDADEHLHYDLTFDKEHVALCKKGAGWNADLQVTWDQLKGLEDDDFFKKSFALALLIHQLYNISTVPEGEANGNVQ